MADVNTSILTALEAGYHPQEIMDHIKNSEDPSHQEWYSNYSANMADRAKEQSAGSIYYNDGSGVVSKENAIAKPSAVSTPLLDYAKNLTPAELAGAGAATLAVVKAPSLYNAYQDRKIEKEKLSIEQRRLNAYEQQVTKQGATPEPVSTVAGQPQGDKLSPLDEARIATERAKAEHIQSKIAIAERAAKLREEQAKAKATKQPTVGAVNPPAGTPLMPIGPTPENPTVPLNQEVGKPPKDAEMVKKAAENPEKNAVAAGRKEAEKVVLQELTRDAKGNIVDAKGNVMSPAAKAGMEAFNAQYPEQAKALAAKGQIGILGAGTSMNSLHNYYGTDLAKQLRNELMGGALLGGQHEYPNISEKIKAIPTDSELGKKLADIRQNNPKGATHGALGKGVTVDKEGNLILGKNNVPKLLAKGAGPAVLLMAMADAAKASTAREGAGVLAEGAFNAFAPMGIAPSELASGTLTEKQLNAYKEAQKLGSPYRSVPPPR